MPIKDTDYWLERAIEKAEQGNRNKTSFWLSCQLRDQRIDRKKAEEVVRQFARHVSQDGGFSEREAMSTLKSAFRREPREPSGTEDREDDNLDREDYASLWRRLFNEPHTVGDQDLSRLVLAMPKPRQAEEPEFKGTNNEWFVLETAARTYYNALNIYDTLSHYSGVSPETLQEFGVGYAEGGNPIYSNRHEHKIGVNTLKNVGLVKEGDDGPYDLFRRRYIFPEFTPLGRVCGFNGRIGYGQDRTPKYLRSPGTNIHPNGAVVYGLWKALDEIEQRNHAVVVEGCVDALTLQDHDIRDAVAILGSSPTKFQMRTLANHVESVTFMYDGDKAGRDAAMRSARTAIRAGVIPHIVNLPDGEDPNDFFQDAEQRADVIGYMRENVIPASDIFREMENERLARDVARIGYVGRRVDVLGYVCDRANWPTEKLMELFSKHHNHCNA